MPNVAQSSPCSPLIAREKFATRSGQTHHPGKWQRLVSRIYKICCAALTLISVASILAQNSALRGAAPLSKNGLRTAFVPIPGFGPRDSHRLVRRQGCQTPRHSPARQEGELLFPLDRLHSLDLENSALAFAHSAILLLCASFRSLTNLPPCTECSSRHVLFCQVLLTQLYAPV